eukprot:3267813-Alexandrium_andersonii.AAC.1
MSASLVGSEMCIRDSTTVAEFRARWLPEKLEAAEVACWGLRWLVGQSAQRAASKRAVLVQHLSLIHI